MVTYAAVHALCVFPFERGLALCADFVVHRLD